MMFRCVHLYDSGRQCSAEAIDGDFCEDHYTGVHVDERLTDHPFQKLVIRFVALVLLVIFLIPFYYTLKTLYAELPVAQEQGR